jgi:4-cresol dehydrogenase (hydroxylating)
MKELTYYFYNSLYLGIPMDKQLNICYFRKKTPVPKFYDLDKDKCGVMWLSPSVPFDGDHITNVLNIMKPLYAKYKLEPNLGFNLMSDRNIACTAAIIYDREVEGQDDNAMSCYKEMNDTLVKEGYIPYRLGIQSMEDIYTNSEAYKKLLNTLKTSVDPNNILSPKHYGIEAYPLANNDETVGIKNKRNAETI